MYAMTVAPVHRISARRKGLSHPSPVGGIAGALAVHDVRGNRENGLRVGGVSIGGILPQLPHKGADQPRGELVNPVIVVAELWEIAFRLIVSYQARLVAYDSHSRVANRRQAVGDDRHTGHAESHRPQRVVIVQRHLYALVGVLVVHVVDDIHGVDVDAREPLHHSFKPVNAIIEVKVLSLDRADVWANLLACDLIAASVDGIEKTLGEVGPRAEELHLFADLHGRDTTCDGPVIAQRAAHDLVVFELNGAGVYRHARGEAAKPFGQARVIPDGQVRLRGWAQVVERLKEAKARPCHKGPPVVSHSGNRLCDPGGIAREKLVVLRRAQETNDAQLDNEVVNDLLRLSFRDRAPAQVAREVDVKEGGGAAQRHRRAVLLLDRREIPEVEPLHGFSRALGRKGDVEAVSGGHLLEFMKRANLLGQFLAFANHILGGHDRV